MNSPTTKTIEVLDLLSAWNSSVSMPQIINPKLKFNLHLKENGLVLELDYDKDTLEEVLNLLTPSELQRVLLFHQALTSALFADNYEEEYEKSLRY